MEKTIPINPGEGNVYINADKDHDVKGSIPKADFFNQVEQELLNVITGYGLEASGEDTGQVKQAIDAAIAAASDGLIKTIRYQSLYQHLKSVENGVIKPEDEKIIGWATVSAETTFSFDTSSCSKNAADDVITLELYLNMPTPVAIHWPAGIMWVENEVPDLSEAGLYLLTFRRIKSVWQGSLNAPFAVFSGS